MAVKTSTQKPTGLDIKIQSGKFVFTWKKKETYGAGQQLQYRILTGKNIKTADSGRNFLKQNMTIKGTKWSSINITKTDQKNNSVSFNLTSYFPNKTNGKFKPVLYGVEFRVKGRAASYTKRVKKGKKYVNVTYTPEWSAWSTKTKIIYEPPKPSKMEASWDENAVNDTTFEWEASSSKDGKPIYKVEYQTIKATTMVKPKDFPMLTEWKTAVSSYKSLSDSDTTQDSGHVGVSFGRIARVRSCGAGGVSDWVYAYHVFAEPYKPVLEEAQTDYDSANYIARTYAAWTQQADIGHPVDRNHLYYRIGVPSANMGVTSDNSWVDAEPSDRTKDRYETALNIDEQIDLDECMWVRVSSEHDADKSYSNIIRTWTSKMKTPGTPVISNQNNTTHKVDVACQNNSTVPGAKVAILWQPEDEPQNSYVIGVIPNGSSSISGLQCPDWTGQTALCLRAYAYVGTEAYQTRSDSVRVYTIDYQMISDEVSTGGSVPLAPSAVSLDRSEVGTGIKVKWNWSWADADRAEIAWSTLPDALMSTNQPQTYSVSNLYSPIFTIGNLTEGETYYVWVRLISGETCGPWSNMAMLHLAKAPVRPKLQLSVDLASPGDVITASWGYVSQDGTPQAYAQVAEKVGNSYVPLAETDVLEQVQIDTTGWSNGTVHQLAVYVVSESNMNSGWSDLVDLKVATPPTATITQASLTQVSFGYELKALPLTVTVTGAGTAGMTELRIIRASDFKEDRPDDTDFTGFAGEVILRRQYQGEEQQTITVSDLESYLDDTAQYTLIATVTDEFGQRSSDAVDFVVAWTVQAVEPVGTVTIVGDAAYITIGTPDGSNVTDTVDVYRMSIDRPELIYRDASFGDVIVDPYPATNGGYRLCLKTENGDYTTASGGLAMTTIDSGYTPLYQYIDFDGKQVGLLLDVDLSSTWEKNFELVQFLGGAQRGYWLDGVNRNGNVTSVMLTDEDVEDRYSLRLLADYVGAAHIRTADGSSFWANINVSTSAGHNEAGKPEALTLSYIKTDMADLDGMTQAEWEAS